MKHMIEKPKRRATVERGKFFPGTATLTVENKETGERANINLTRLEALDLAASLVLLTGGAE